MSGQASGPEGSLVLKRSLSGEDAGGGEESISATATGPGLERSPSQAEETTNGKRVQTKGESGKKRRKVNHACVYCRRSHMTCDQERPCTRCIKRSIGHLCHDEPRENIKKSKSDLESVADASNALKHESSEGSNSEPTVRNGDMDSMTTGTAAGMPTAETTDPSPITKPQLLPDTVSSAYHSSNSASFMGFSDWPPSVPAHQFQDMQSYHPNLLFQHPEVSNEYNLLNEFLSSSLLDDGGLYPGANDQAGQFSDVSLSSMMGPLSTFSAHPTMIPQTTTNHAALQAAAGNAISRPSSAFPIDKALETYYMTAADPAGTDTAEERMNKLLKAKYDAGMLKPFNYVKGYARLNSYMERNLQAPSKQRILRQLDKFRPKFRERMQKLTDLELVLVEMWFERKLMKYDRVFASMAIPACCWRRTGEIFRGNREMAELIHVPLEQLRDGKIAIHEIIVEDSLVSYWEKFGAIAFDASQKAILTSCSLKHPTPSSKGLDLKCCFSFTIQRDNHHIPSLIVGNFLPITPAKR